MLVILVHWDTLGHKEILVTLDLKATPASWDPRVTRALWDPRVILDTQDLQAQ